MHCKKSLEGGVVEGYVDVQFQFEIVASFYCPTCDCIREDKKTLWTTVAEPLGSQLFALSSQQDRMCPVCGNPIPPEAQCAIRPAGPTEMWPSEWPWRWNRTPQTPPEQAAREMLRGLASGCTDVYETYRSLFHLWLTQNAAVPELRPLFSIPGIEPDGQLSVTNDFRNQLRSLATAILAKLQD